MRLEIDPTAIRDNVRVLHERLATPVMAVVKANAYGHGAVLAARAALEGGAAWLGCADTDEALRLRSAGIDAPILAWLHGDDPHFEDAVAADVRLGVSSAAQLERAADVGATVHLKIDSGLGRNGIPRAEWDDVVARAVTLQSEGRVRVEGVFSHIAGAGEAHDHDQLRAFEDAVTRAAALEVTETHLSASSFALSEPAGRGTLVRVGIASYGLHPDGSPHHDGAAAAALGLRPAMRALAQVRGGVLDAGQRDGLLPPLHGSPPVVVGGERAALDALGDRESAIAAPDGDAVLFGDPAMGDPSAEAWAHAAGTIAYEVVTRMMAAIERTVVPAVTR